MGDVVEDVVQRTAGRVLLIDAAGRLLLLRGSDPADPQTYYWFTIGGGVDDGETFAQAAARELYEETGLRREPSDLDGPVWTDVAEFSFDGVRYRQQQKFFVARVDRWEPSRAGFDHVEQQFVDSFGWWSVADLLSPQRTEKVYPAELPEILKLVA
jgi:8-oxo-dGTP pyrophosphatase MutT (NUDIX family)